VTAIGSGYSITATTYNWKNLPTAITKSGTTYNYRYDHTGLRVYKQEGDNIHTLRGAFGETLAVYRNGNLDHWNIVRPDGSVIGRREGSTRLYYHRDHLGSTRAVVNASGTVVGTYDYYPFGLEMPGRISTTGMAPRQKFTSHELDTEVDLYYMVARRYAAEFGRFLSVDPLADEYPAWSPYHYVLNNPLLFTDPTGMCPEEESDRGCTGGIAGRFFESLRSTLSGMEMPFQFGALLAADQAAGEITDEVKDAAADAAKTGVDAGIIVADGVSDGSTIVAGAGVVAAPFTKGASLGVTGVALSTGAIADVTSTALKGLDAAIFDGSTDAVMHQAIKTGLNLGGGKVLRQASGTMVRVNTAGRFYNPSTGRFVSNQYGNRVVAARDATNIAIPVIYQAQHKR